MTDSRISASQQDFRRATAWRAVIEGSLAALAVYVIAGGGEAALISVLHPTELELTWVSDVVLAVAFGIAVYLWRNLRATRHELTTLERADPSRPTFVSEMTSRERDASVRSTLVTA